MYMPYVSGRKSKWSRGFGMCGVFGPYMGTLMVSAIAIAAISARDRDSDRRRQKSKY